MAGQQRGSARQERCNDLLKQKACWRWVIVRPAGLRPSDSWTPRSGGPWTLCGEIANATDIEDLKS